jgi:GNAT superfamily N-acetyltransferase
MREKENSRAYPDFDWQPLTEADMDTVAAIAARLHPGLPERTAVLAEKWRLCPDGCRKLLCGGVMRGYGLSHPGTLARPPKLDCLMGGLPDPADCLFLHDVAVLPEARGRGASVAFIAHAAAVATARRLPSLALIAAYGTGRLWRRFGFEDVPPEVTVGDGAASLAAYGADARYLSRRLSY